MVEISCEAILFDLDGVLVDSSPAVTRVWNKWALAHGLDTEETVRLAHGRPSIATVRDILPDADFEAENEVILCGELEDTEGVVSIPGVRELLQSLPPERWALATSCARPLADVQPRAPLPPLPKKNNNAHQLSHHTPHPN